MTGFKLGELILSSEPYVYCLYDKYNGQYCDSCFKKNADLKRCAKCHYPYYCNKTCQKNGWLQHKNECKYIEKSETNFAGMEGAFHELRLITLIIFKIKKHGKEEPCEEVGRRKVSFSTLMSHVEDIKKDAKSYSKVLALEENLKQFIEPADVPLLDEFTEIFGKLCINSFKIDSGLKSIGCGLYLSASIFDHACDFDAFRSFDGPIMNIRTVKNLPHRNIEKVFITYIDVSKFTEERQTLLRENYYFTCQCAHCTTFKFDELKAKLLDDSEKTKVEARQCKEKLEYIQELRNDPETDPERLYKVCREALKIQSKIMPKTNLCNFRIAEIAFEICLKTGKYTEALDIGHDLDVLYRIYYDYYHDSVGYFLFEYGLILLEQDQPRKAISVLSEADNILKITRGEQYLHKEQLQIVLQIAKFGEMLYA